MAKTDEVFSPKNILRYPRLDTVLMVERAIREADDCPTKTKLWKSLPRRVMYQTFCTIIDYLVHSGKIIVDERDNKIVWVWDPEGVKEALNKPHLIVRPKASAID